VFDPILMFGCSTHKIEADWDAINNQILERKIMKIDVDVTKSFNEDSAYPSTKECKQVLQQIQEIARKEIHSRLTNFNEWAHVVEPDESTMIHTHTVPNKPDFISWVLWTKAEKGCGSLVHYFSACNRQIIKEFEPEVGKLLFFPDFIPHFTKKNNSGVVRISLSGNMVIPPQDIKDASPENIFNYVGVTDAR